MLVNLFSEGGTLVLEQENHERVSEARTNHRLSLKDRFTSGFFSINGGWHVLGIGLSLVLITLASACILGEHVRRLHVGGIILIATGVACVLASD